MDKTLFNLHDFILLVIAFESFAIVAYLALNKAFRTTAIFLLMGFFVAHAFIAIHELVLWGSTFRYWVLELSPNLFFLLNVSYWLDGPLLYLFIRALVQAEAKLCRFDALHLIPALLFCVFIFSHFYVLDLEAKIQLIKDYSFADFHYVSLDFLAKTGRIVYLLFALRLLQRCQPRFTTRSVIPLWLPKVLVAFGIILLWETILSALKVYHSVLVLSQYSVVEFIGLTDYYGLFLLINAVIFLSASHFAGANQAEIKAVKKEPVNQVFVQRLERAMSQDKLFLNQYLSFERLAEKLDIPVKELSSTINRHYKVNFYEFINSYRIEEARRLLDDPEQNHRSISDIFYDAGFNSKSVYNTLFKKTFAQTPSQYRKQRERAAI